MLNIVLFEPEIPQNTGNIARTCAVTGTRLHLIKPLGFDISDKAVKRAGLDYWHMVDLHVYENLEDFFRKTGAQDRRAGYLAGHSQGSPTLHPGALPARLLADVRQREHRPAGGLPCPVCRTLHPYSRPGGGALPQPGQFGGHSGL